MANALLYTSDVAGRKGGCPLKSAHWLPRRLEDIVNLQAAVADHFERQSLFPLN